MANIIVAGAALNQIPMHWENNLANIREAISLAKSTICQKIKPRQRHTDVQRPIIAEAH